jgi:hypothetical protein
VEQYLHSPNTLSWRGAQLGGAEGQLYLYLYLYSSHNVQNERMFRKEYLSVAFIFRNIFGSEGLHYKPLEELNYDLYWSDIDSTLHEYQIELQ